MQIKFSKVRWNIETLHLQHQHNASSFNSQFFWLIRLSPSCIHKRIVLRFWGIEELSESSAFRLNFQDFLTPIPSLEIQINAQY